MSQTDQHLLAQKSVVVYTKTGPAIYHSHHDMIRFWERAVKRAAFPMRMTQGFNPRPRIVFPHALGLGIASVHEEVELELHAPMADAALFEAARSAAGDVLGIVRVFGLPPVKKSRRIVASSYRVSGWPERAREKLEDAAQKVMALPEIAVHRGAPGNTRSLDCRPFLENLAVEAGVLLLSLIHNESGSARPQEIVAAVAAVLDVDPAPLDILKTGMTLE